MRQTIHDSTVRDLSRLADSRKGQEMENKTMGQCVECGRVFDLTDETDASEYYYGHDCEE